MFCVLLSILISKTLASPIKYSSYSLPFDYYANETTEFYEYEDYFETGTYAEHEYLDYENIMESIDLEKVDPDLERDEQFDLEEKKDYTHYGLIDKLGGDGDAKSKGHYKESNHLVFLLIAQVLKYNTF